MYLIGLGTKGIKGKQSWFNFLKNTYYTNKRLIYLSGIFKFIIFFFVL